MGRKKRSESPMSFFSFQDIVACVTGIMIMVTLLLALDPLSSKIQEVRTAKVKASVVSEMETKAVEAQQLAVEEARARLAQLKEELEARRSRPAVSLVEVERAESAVTQSVQAIEVLTQRVRMSESQVEAAVEVTKTATAKCESIESETQDVLRRISDAKLRTRVRRVEGEVVSTAPIMVEVMIDGIRWGALDKEGTPRQLGETPQADALKGLGVAFAGHTPTDAHAVFVVHSDAISQFEDLRGAVAAKGFGVGWQLWPDKWSVFEDEPIGMEPGQ